MYICTKYRTRVHKCDWNDLLITQNLNVQCKGLVLCLEKDNIIIYLIQGTGTSVQALQFFQPCDEFHENLKKRNPDLIITVEGGGGGGGGD